MLSSNLVDIVCVSVSLGNPNEHRHWDRAPLLKPGGTGVPESGSSLKRLDPECKVFATLIHAINLLPYFSHHFQINPRVHATVDYSVTWQHSNWFTCKQTQVSRKFANGPLPVADPSPNNVQYWRRTVDANKSLLDCLFGWLVGWLGLVCLFCLLCKWPYGGPARLIKC